jgi:hypothetical protein
VGLSPLENCDFESLHRGADAGVVARGEEAGGLRRGERIVEIRKAGLDPFAHLRDLLEGGALEPVGVGAAAEACKVV